MSACTGRLATAMAPGATLGYGYDGSLLLTETWLGSVSGAVAWTYDHDFRITVESVRGANDERQSRVARAISGQWRAMPDGIDGIHGNGGNVVSVTYRF